MAKTITKQLVEERPEDLSRKAHYPKNLTHDGREIPDPTPMAPPLGYIKQPSMMENMRAMIRSEALRAHALAEGQETFDEADDFDTPDDDEIDPASPYEANFDPLADQDRRALARTLPGDDDPELQRYIRPRPAPSKGTDPVEGGDEGSPDTPSDPPAGPLQRVREHLRRKPDPK